MSAPSKYRIAIPRRRFTPFRGNVFHNVLPSLDELKGATFFAVIYDWAWHSKPAYVTASLADLAQRSGLDERTAAKCLAELERKGLVRTSIWNMHSHINRP